ncbi:MAG: DUF3592 domain-containing protein [Desulfuromonadales bacterium]|nr:DUF3592 domain-containing protein [Desulfuromonadales bacterium]
MSGYKSWFPARFVINAVVGIIFGSLLMTASGCSKAASGPLVVGTVVSTRPTNTYVNSQPQIEMTMQFTTLDGKQVTSSYRKVIPFTALAQIQPGLELPLRYDPKNPRDIMIDWKVDEKMFQKMVQEKDQKDYVQRLVATGQLTKKELNIKEKGVQAKGILISSKPTGRIVNGDETEMVLHVKVTRPDGSTFDVTITAGVAQRDIQYALPGSMVYVEYMPNDEKNILLEWNN